MSNREFAKNLIDYVPKCKLLYVVAYLQGIAAPDETPNAETLASMAEIEEMIKTGGGERLDRLEATTLFSARAGETLPGLFQIRLS